MESVSQLIGEAIESINQADAEKYLRTYFGLDGAAPYGGAMFETIGHRWDDEACVDTVTPADLLSLSMLNVPIAAETIAALLEPDLQARLGSLLAKIPATATIVDEANLLAERSAARELWAELSAVPGLVKGTTTKSKLFARKRPLLVPIYDSVVRDFVRLSGPDGFWLGMRDALMADESSHYRRAEGLVRDLGLQDRVTPLRAIDVTLWMHGQQMKAQAR